MLRLNDLLYDKLSIINWNIGNPSLERASKQAKWLAKQDADILVLTECKNSKGGNLLESSLNLLGYHVFFDKPKNKEYGLLVATKYSHEKSSVSDQVDYLPNRFASIVIENDIELLGTYIPSRGYDAEKKRRKRQFIESIQGAIETQSDYSKRIVIGDFNILEPGHIPRYTTFENWEYDFYIALEQIQLVDAFRMVHPDVKEYSWFGRNGNGYRYDHCFISLELLQYLEDCRYLHDTRELKLSDHSAQLMILSKGK